MSFKRRWFHDKRTRENVVQQRRDRRLAEIDSAGGSSWARLADGEIREEVEREKERLHEQGAYTMNLDDQRFDRLRQLEELLGDEDDDE